MLRFVRWAILGILGAWRFRLIDKNRCFLNGLDKKRYFVAAGSLNLVAPMEGVAVALVAGFALSDDYAQLR